jgi:1-phosphofructokinase family hexose kinase
MIVCAAPSPSIDKLFTTPALTPGGIHRPDALVARAGGKGLNVARAAHALGCDVLAVALVAGHAGRWIAERLDEDGVPSELVWGEGETRTSLSVAADGALTEFYERGDPPGEAAWERYRERVAQLAPAGGWLALSGSLPVGVAAAESGRLVALARAAGARAAVDQHGPHLAASLTAAPELVKVNASEAEELTGATTPEAAAAALRRRLLEAGAVDPVVVVTLGERGALLLEGGEPVHGRLDLRAPYPVGSGDAFLAGLLAAAPPPGGSWRDALALALGSGAANAEVPGAGSLDPARARTLAAQTR